MEIDVGADLRIKGLNSEENQKMKTFLNSNLIIDNPQYYKLQKMGKWLGKTEKYINLYSRLENGFLVPFGSLKSIYNLFPYAKYSIFRF